MSDDVIKLENVKIERDGGVTFVILNRPEKRNAMSPQLHMDMCEALDWAEEGPRHWRVILRCPDCESRREGVFEQTIVERLDDELDRGSAALLSDLRRMTHANMSEEVEFFVRALDADLITPSDF